MDLGCWISIVVVFELLEVVWCIEDSCSSKGDSCSSGDFHGATSIYDFHAKDIDGNEVSLDKYRGLVVLVVNVACNCGFTEKSYTQMQELYKKYESDGLRIACFPSNQFMGQEPWSESEIKKFVVDTFGVAFDMYSKVDVNGDGAHPLWKYLKSKQPGTFGDWIKWNFTKFLIDRRGQPIKRYSSLEAPLDFEDDIVNALGVSKKR